MQFVFATPVFVVPVVVVAVFAAFAHCGTHARLELVNSPFFLPPPHLVAFNAIAFCPHHRIVCQVFHPLPVQARS